MSQLMVNRRAFLRNALLVGAGGAVSSQVLAVSGSAPAYALDYGAYYAIIPGALITKRSSGFLDIAIDPDPGESLVYFRVWVDGIPGPLAQAVTVNGFASSSNLHAGLAPGHSVLVEARIDSPSTRATGSLRQRDPDAVLGIGPAGPYGTIFRAAVGPLLDGATLLIGNKSEGDAPIDVTIGNLAPSSGGPVGRRMSAPGLPPKTVWEVPLRAGDENSHILVRSTTDVLVRLLIRIGNRYHQVHEIPQE